jgi:hypothetical protein
MGELITAKPLLTTMAFSTNNSNLPWIKAELTGVRRYLQSK